MTVRQGLVRITKQPQGQRCPGSTADARVLSIYLGMAAMTSRVVEGSCLVQVGTGGDECSHVQVRIPHDSLGFQIEIRVLVTVGHTEELLPDIEGLLQRSMYAIKRRQSPEDVEQFWCLPHLLTKGTRSGIGGFHLWRRIA